MLAQLVATRWLNAVVSTSQACQDSISPIMVIGLQLVKTDVFIYRCRFLSNKHNSHSYANFQSHLVL